MYAKPEEKRRFDEKDKKSNWDNLQEEKLKCRSQKTQNGCCLVLELHAPARS